MRDRKTARGLYMLNIAYPQLIPYKKKHVLMDETDVFCKKTASTF